MKRKAITVIFSVIALVLGACNSAKGVSDNANNVASAGSDNAKNDVKIELIKESSGDRESIKLNPSYIAIDDDNLKMEIYSVSKTIRNAGSKSEYITYSIDFSVTNKSKEYDILVSTGMGEACIGPYTVVFGNSNNNVRAGKITEDAGFTVLKYTDGSFSDKGVEHIESVEDLLTFNAIVTVGLLKDNQFVESYQKEISLEGISQE